MNRNRADADALCKGGCGNAVFGKMLVQRLHEGTLPLWLRLRKTEFTIMGIDVHQRKPYKPAMANRLKEWRERRGLSLARLGDLVGSSAPHMHRLENGQRKLTKEWADILAPALGVSPLDLFYTRADIENELKRAPASLRTQSISVIGAAQAGAWRAALQWDAADQYEVATVLDDSYRQKTVYGLEVRGSSMNRRYPEGSVVICVPTAEYDLEISDGKRVHVEIRRGGEVEATIKRYRLDADAKPWLWPESDDPLWQSPIPAEPTDGDDATEVVIAGVVIGCFLKED